MKYLFYFIACLLLFNSTAFGQDRSITKFGTIDKSDLEMKYYERDSSAEAIILYDYADEFFEWNNIENEYEIISKIHYRVKILNKSALYRATVKLSYFHNNALASEHIDDIKGATYNLENGVIVTTKLTKESIFDEAVVENDYQKRIVMPNVKVGSVFEFTYTREIPFSIRNRPGTWYFQSDIPNLWSEINVVVPDYFNYSIIKIDYYPLFINHNEHIKDFTRNNGVPSTQYRFVTRDMPAFRTEPYITAKSDYISKVEFELAGYQFPNGNKKNFSETWDDITNTLLASDRFGHKLNQTHYLKEEVETLEAIKDSTEKMNAAFQYISRNIKWDNTSNTIYSNQEIYKTIENKKGTAAEINLLMTSLLRQLGFDANPVILSTRGNGKIKEANPMLTDFDYVITDVNLDGKEILMDATDPLTYPGLLPERCLNGKGRLIKKGNARFVSLEPAEKYSKFEYINAALNVESGEIKGNYSISSSGYRALEKRYEMKNDDDRQVRKNITDSKPDWQIDSIKIEGVETLTEPIKISYDFSFDYTVSSEKTIYFNPILSGKIKNNPFKAADRIYPVDMGKPTDEIFVASIKIPKGYAVEELPKSEVIKLPDEEGKFTYSIDVIDNTIRVSSRLIINKTFFTVAQYPYLRQLYDRAVQKHSELIVLKKSD